MAATPQPINKLNARARLGEGPVWDADQQRLFWVDIYNHRLHQYYPETAESRFIELDDLITGLAIVDRDRLILARRSGLDLLHLPSQAVTPLVDIEGDRPNNRLNDLKCDPHGRLFMGSMNNDEQPEARLCRYDPDGTLTVIETKLSISNGLGWSPDQQTFYLTDSPAQLIYAYDYDGNTGAIANRRVLIDLTPESFFPDGLAIDADGCIWSAMWDGWCVIRFDPQGQEMQRIAMPIQRPTSCAFGGSDLNQLWITSASIGLSQMEIQAQTSAGDLFCVDLDIRGLPVAAFKLEAVID
ncbi:MAG: SMP-30/gluconolactonase/LRE family protein [Cyanobacteria bacterium P01_H01_bin.119]